jgi:hypothetical protein
VSRSSADEEVAFTLTRAEVGVVLSGLRYKRKKAAKARISLDRKFGDEAVVMTERDDAIDSAIRKVRAAMHAGGMDVDESL